MELKRIHEKRAELIYQHYNSEPIPIDRPGLSSEEFIIALLEESEYSDLIKFLAYAFEPQLAIWWTCCCIRNSYGIDAENKSIDQYSNDHKLDEIDLKILNITERFVNNPTDEDRRLAMALAHERGLEYSSSWCAMATFWSQGSLAKDNEPEISPPPYLYTYGVIAALNIAANDYRTQENKEYDFQIIMKQFIDFGLAIASGNNINIKQ